MYLIMLKKYDICFAIIQKMFRKILLSLISALLLVFSWPPHGFPFLIFGAFLPLFFLIDSVSKERIALSYSFIVFLLWNLGTTFWIFHASLFGVIMAILVNSLLMTGVFALFLWIKSKYKDRRAWWSLVVFWLSFEYLHFQWDLSWPWLTLGNVFAHYPKWVQWYEYTGVLGGSLLVILFNIVLYHSIIKRKIYGFILFILCLPFLFNFFIKPKTLDSNVLDIVVVQPNIDPYIDKFSGLSSVEQLEQFIELAQTKLDTNVDVLIGPETAIVDGLWENRIEFSNEIIRLRELFQEHPKLQIIIGATTLKAYSSNQKLSATARQIKNSDTFYDVYNSALHITPNQLSIYHKSKLVQGVEFMPFSFILDKLDFLFINLGGISGSLGTQNYREVFKANNVSIAPIICYESVFGDYTTEYIRNGANVMAIITNDGWWKNTPGYKQHLNYASLRAIENRRSIARSANTGISAFIQLDGTIIQPTVWDQATAIRGQLITNTHITFYTRYGDYIGRISAFLAIMFVCFSLASWVKR